MESDGMVLTEPKEREVRGGPITKNDEKTSAEDFDA
jgi:hypothetical protein